MMRTKEFENMFERLAGHIMFKGKNGEKNNEILIIKV